MRIAALTMIYNEPVWAPVWARHYATQVGAENCFILDHGSDDGSTHPDHLGLAMQVETLPRSPLDEEWRRDLVADRVKSLLVTYDAVIHTDVDELLIADPARWDGLQSWAKAGPPPVVTAIGLDLQHIPTDEPPLDPARSLYTQRRWVRFAAAMCKPAWVTRTVDWSPGFHSSDAPLILCDLYLIHLRYADLAAGLNRLARSRAQAFAAPEIGRHQRVPDHEFIDMMHAIATLPRRHEPIATHAVPLRPWLDRLLASRIAREAEPYKLDLALSGDELWDGARLLQTL